MLIRSESGAFVHNHKEETKNNSARHNIPSHLFRIIYKLRTIWVIETNQKSEIGRNAWLISLSAFFSDLGYQSVIAAIPIYLVLILHAPVYLFGIVMGFSYGLGALMAFIGGKLADLYGRKKIAILGNALIPILSMSGLFSNVYESSASFTIGWLFRNFRTPARRALISEDVSDANRGKVFGLLNALDVGGGALSITLLIVALMKGLEISEIILLTSIPIAMATILLAFVKEKRRTARRPQEEKQRKNSARKAYIGVLIASSLYGFSFFSLGFPILTIAQAKSSLAGIGSYLVYLLASAFFGYIIGSSKLRLISTLSFLGYVLSSTGTLLLAFAYSFHLSCIIMYLSVAIMGMAIGTIDTLEPNLITQVAPESAMGNAMGALTASRSIGLFLGNTVMGILYYFKPFYSYAYASILSFAAGLILFAFGRELKGLI